MAHLTALSTGNLSLDSHYVIENEQFISSSSTTTSTGSSRGSLRNISDMGVGGGHHHHHPHRRQIPRRIASPDTFSCHSVSLTSNRLSSMQGLNIPRAVSPDGGGLTSPSTGGKRSGLQGWLVGDNSRRMKNWWAARSGTDLHKMYAVQMQDTDGKGFYFTTYIGYVSQCANYFLLITSACFNCWYL